MWPGGRVDMAEEFLSLMLSPQGIVPLVASGRIEEKGCRIVKGDAVAVPDQPEEDEKEDG